MLRTNNICFQFVTLHLDTFDYQNRVLLDSIADYLSSHNDVKSVEVDIHLSLRELIICYFCKVKRKIKFHLIMNAILNFSIILAIVIMQLDNLFVCYKVTDLVQNENPDLYKHYKGPYSLFKKKRLVLNSIWFTKIDREKLSSECKRLFLRQRIDYLGSAFAVVIWIILILVIIF